MSHKYNEDINSIFLPLSTPKHQNLLLIALAAQRWMEDSIT